MTDCDHAFVRSLRTWTCWVWWVVLTDWIEKSFSQKWFYIHLLITSIYYACRLMLAQSFHTCNALWMHFVTPKLIIDLSFVRALWLACARDRSMPNVLLCVPKGVEVRCYLYNYIICFWALMVLTRTVDYMTMQDWQFTLDPQSVDEVGQSGWLSARSSHYHHRVWFLGYGCSVAVEEGWCIIISS